MLPNKRGKIALISVHGDPAIDVGKEEAGGQNVYVRQVGEALSRLGWQVDMFTRRSDAQQEKIVEHNSNCRTIRLTAGPAEFIERQKIYNYVSDFVSAFFDFQHETKTIYPIIHTNYWLSAAVGKEIRQRQQVKTFHTYHSLGAVKYKSVTTIPMIASTRLNIEKKCLENSDVVVATSPQEKQHMQTLVSTKGNIDIVPCGTDIDIFGKVSRNESREKLDIDSDAKVVFYAGRFDPRKGIETLVRAVGKLDLERYANFKLIIAGGSTSGQKDGREKERIEGIVRELELETVTTFVGQLEHSTLASYYAAADVCVVPSHYEPFGLVAIEAMAAGTPVVASAVGGLQYTVVDRETGFLAPPKNEEAFANAISRILDDSQERDRLGKAAKKRVKSQFSWTGVAKQLDELYLEELGRLHQEFLTSNVVS
ncbi:glycosyltransferase [Myxosarcina sp. GI1]|uniref:glycosyltransferase n=1 Tax=Myxosarcina sp. GI1 TaxID=1541065 RepID=UPI000565D6DB|nr:glycosyltransferase [Myxosarcina sp. GI1]